MRCSRRTLNDIFVNATLCSLLNLSFVTPIQSRFGTLVMTEKNPRKKSGKSVISVLINQKYEDLFHKIPSGYPYVLWFQGQTKYLETNFSLDVHILPQWDLCMWPLIALMIFRMILHECRVLTQMSVSVVTLIRGHEVCRILLTPINY